MGGMGLLQQFLLACTLQLAFFVPLEVAESVMEGATTLATWVSHGALSGRLQEHASSLQEMRASLYKVDSLRNAEWKGTLANNIEKLMAKLGILDTRQRMLEADVNNATFSRNQLQRDIAVLTKSLNFMTKETQQRRAKMTLARTAIEDISGDYSALALAARNSVGSYGSTCNAGAPVDLDLDEQAEMVSEMHDVGTTPPL